MGYFGKLKQRKETIALRKKGMSLRQIEKIVGVSRSSISLWTRDIVLSTEQLLKLQSNREYGQKRASQVAATNKIKRRQELTKVLLEEGRYEMGLISKRDRFIFGVGLYFSEGNKSDKFVGFTNSDPRSIKFMSSWFREFCDVKIADFRCNLYIHDTCNEVEARKYWSKLTQIPLSQFKKSYIVENNPKRLRKTKYEYGICRLVVGDVNILRKIMGWISGVFGV